MSDIRDIRDLKWFAAQRAIGTRFVYSILLTNEGRIRRMVHAGLIERARGPISGYQLTKKGADLLFGGVHRSLSRLSPSCRAAFRRFAEDGVIGKDVHMHKLARIECVALDRDRKWHITHRGWREISPRYDAAVRLGVFGDDD